MLRIKCACALSIICLSATHLLADDSRVLYALAAQQMAEKDFASAAKSLAKLRDEYPNSIATKLSQQQLLECLVATGQGIEALAMVSGIEAAEIIGKLGEPDAQIELPSQTHNLANRAIQCAVFELESNDQFPEAIRLQILAHDIQKSRQHRKSILRIGIRGSVLLARECESYQEILDTIPEQLRADFLFGLAEAFENAGDIDRAQSTLEVLISDLRSRELTKRETQDSELPSSKSAKDALLPTACLKLASLQTRKKSTMNALTLAQQCRAEFPEFKHAQEFSFLVTQNLIAQIRFEEAHSVLQEVLNTCSKNPKACARAQWLAGELFFLQDRLQLAKAAYSQVEAYSVAEWTHRAQLQRAKCLELLQEPEAAYELYKSLSLLENNKISSQAQERLVQLGLNTPPHKVASPASSPTTITSAKRQ